MTIQFAIESAIKGGWNSKSRTPEFVASYDGEHIAFVFLDPSFWRCLSKSDGWDEGFLLKNALRGLSEFVGKDAVMMAYNVSFDRMFLEAAYRECGLPYPFHYRHLDLMSIVWSKGGWTDPPSFTNACQLFDIPPEPTIHRALAGALKAFDVWQAL